jgi:hypothetical protein
MAKGYILLVCSTDTCQYPKRYLMKLYGGIDLHATSNYLGIIDGQDRRVFKKKLRNEPQAILKTLDQFKDEILGVVVESTFNWYWLVTAVRL